MWLVGFGLWARDGPIGGPALWSPGPLNTHLKVSRAGNKRLSSQRGVGTGYSGTEGEG